MSRGLDHIVHLVRDLDAATETYRRLGFTVGTRNRHPWGTHNAIVQFPGFFIELLTVAEPGEIVAHGGRTFSFGAFNRDALARGEGLTMLVLESRDAEADRAAFGAAGIGDFDRFDFARKGTRPDGSVVEVAFSLAFARDPGAPGVGFFVCQQHFPENFWNPAFQAHANGAAGVAGAVLVAENPAEHQAFLQAFAGEREIRATSAGLTVPTARGDIRVMDAAAFRLRYRAAPPDVAQGARLAALRLQVTDLGRARAATAAGGVAVAEMAGCLVIGPGEAHGATLVLEPGSIDRAVGGPITL